MLPQRDTSAAKTSPDFVLAVSPLSSLSSLSPLAAVLQRRDVWIGDRLAVSYDTLSSGFSALDAVLPGGGWPRGALVDLMHARRGIGELAIVLPALAALTMQDEWVLLQAPPQPVFAPAWRAAGVRLPRLIVVDALPENTRLAAGDTLWAAEQILRAGSIGAALLWLSHGTTAAQLRRLQVAAEAGGTLAFLLQDESRLAAASPAPLRLRLEAQDNSLVVHLIKRRGAPLGRPVRLSLERGVQRPGESGELDRSGELPMASLVVPANHKAGEHAESRQAAGWAR